jgi:hypothetical protein
MLTSMKEPIPLMPGLKFDTEANLSTETLVSESSFETDDTKVKPASQDGPWRGLCTLHYPSVPKIDENFVNSHTTVLDQGWLFAPACAAHVAGLGMGARMVQPLR